MCCTAACLAVPLSLPSHHISPGTCRTLHAWLQCLCDGKGATHEIYSLAGSDPELQDLVARIPKEADVQSLQQQLREIRGCLRSNMTMGQAGSHGVPVRGVLPVRWQADDWGGGTWQILLHTADGSAQDRHTPLTEALQNGDVQLVLVYSRAMEVEQLTSVLAETVGSTTGKHAGFGCLRRT